MATDHKALAEALRSRLASTSGLTDPTLRRGAARRASGGLAAPEPYDTLARQIGEAAFRVTDGQVSAVRAASGSDKATFEIVMAAAIGAGLCRWDNAMRALDEATNAAE